MGVARRPAFVTCRFTHVYPDGPAPYCRDPRNREQIGYKRMGGLGIGTRKCREHSLIFRPRLRQVFRPPLDVPPRRGKRQVERRRVKAPAAFVRIAIADLFQHAPAFGRFARWHLNGDRADVGSGVSSAEMLRLGWVGRTCARAWPASMLSAKLESCEYR